MKQNYLLLVLLFTSTLFSQSHFLPIPKSNYVANRSAPVQVVATIAYQGYDEGQAYFGEGEYEIFPDFIDGVLDKPIIVLDGFDPGDSRDIGGLYNILSFDGENLADILRDEGFDIVILNAPQYTTDGKDIDGGADYIQRNAMVLVELIELLNDQKVGEEELVILGPSMGGLIARYALAYMEQNTLDPETRLYISFDSPHLGANIPISLQYLINYLAESVGDPDAQAIVEQVLKSPAAKEMLIDHVLGHLAAGSTFEQDPAKLLPEGAPDFRDAFQDELDGLGFPQSVRNVSMINGSGLGLGTGTPGMQVIDTTLDLALFVTADVRLHFLPLAGQTNNVTFFETFILGISQGAFVADGESFPFSDGVDSAPGGTGNIADALGAAGSNQVILDFIAALDQEEYSFIPTISALAIENEDDWYASPDIGGVHDSGFVNSFIPDINEPHVTVTQENAQFALDEIRQGVLGNADLVLEQRYTLMQNPVKDMIKLKLNPGMDFNQVEIAVIGIAGQTLIQQEFSNEYGEIAIEQQLPKGLYLLKIKDPQGIFNLKFLVN